MICPTCRGYGKTAQGVPWNSQWLPCPECGGCGLAHCCERDCVQPAGEPPVDETARPDP